MIAAATVIPCQRSIAAVAPAGSAEKLIPEETLTLINEERRFARVSWFRTFGENIPRLADLEDAQVKLLANLAAWTVTEAVTKKKIEEAFPDVFPVDPGASADRGAGGPLSDSYRRSRPCE